MRVDLRRAIGAILFMAVATAFFGMWLSLWLLPDTWGLLEVRKPILIVETAMSVFIMAFAWWNLYKEKQK